jgi:hypothetical protein
MTAQIVRALGFSRKLWLSAASLLVIAVSIFFGLVHIMPVRAQSAAENPAQNIADTWQGTLHAGQDLRTVVKISKADGGGYKALFYSIDQGGAPLPVTKITLEGTTVKMSLTMIGGTSGAIAKVTSGPHLQLAGWGMSPCHEESSWFAWRSAAGRRSAAPPTNVHVTQLLPSKLYCLPGF